MSWSSDEEDTLPQQRQQHHSHAWRPRPRTRCRSATELRRVDKLPFAVVVAHSSVSSASSSSSAAFSPTGSSPSKHGAIGATNIYENLSFPALHRRWCHGGSEAEAEEEFVPRCRLPPRPPTAANACQRRSSGAETENGSGSGDRVGSAGFKYECDASSALLSSHYFTQSDTSDADELMAEECDALRGPPENAAVESDDETTYRRRKNVLGVAQTMRRDASDDYRNIFMRFTPPRRGTAVVSPHILRRKQQQQQDHKNNNNNNKKLCNNNKYALRNYHSNYDVGPDDDCCCGCDADCKRMRRKRSRARTTSGGSGLVSGKQLEGNQKEAAATATTTTTTTTTNTSSSTTKAMAARRRRKRRTPAAGSSVADGGGGDDDDDGDGDNDSDNSGEDDIYRRPQQQQQQQQQPQRLEHRKRSGADKMLTTGGVAVRGGEGTRTATGGRGGGRAVIKTTPEAAPTHRHHRQRRATRPRLSNSPRQRHGHHHYLRYRLPDEDALVRNGELRLSLNSDVEICTSPVLLDDFRRDIHVGGVSPPPALSGAERLSTGAIVATENCEQENRRLTCYREDDRRRETSRTRSRRRRQKRRAILLSGTDEEHHHCHDSRAKKPMASTPYYGGADNKDVTNQGRSSSGRQWRFVPLLTSPFLPPLPSTLPPSLPTASDYINGKSLRYPSSSSNFCTKHLPRAAVAPTNDYCNTYYYSGADSGCLEDESELPATALPLIHCDGQQRGKADDHWIYTSGHYNDDGNETEFMNISDKIYENLRKCNNAFVATTSSSAAATERADTDETLREPVPQQLLRHQSPTTLRRLTSPPAATVFSAFTQATATTTTTATTSSTSSSSAAATTAALCTGIMVTSSCCASSSSSSSSSGTSSSTASSERSKGSSTHFPVNVTASPEPAARPVQCVSFPDEPALYGRLVGIVVAEARRHWTAWQKVLDAQHQLDHVLCACHRGWRQQAGNEEDEEKESGTLMLSLCRDRLGGGDDDADRAAFERSCAIFCDRVARRLRCAQSASLKDYNQQLRKLQKVLDQLKASIVSAQQQQQQQQLLLQKQQQHCQRQAALVDNKENAPLHGGKTPLVEGGATAGGGGGSGGRAINKLFGRIRHIL